jgi:hypothetical protein
LVAPFNWVVYASLDRYGIPWAPTFRVESAPL